MKNRTNMILLYAGLSLSFATQVAADGVVIDTIYQFAEDAGLAIDTVIQEDDEVFFIADRKDIRVFMSEMRRLEDPVRRVVIAGGGNIGVRLALALEQTNQVKIIERDMERARRVSEDLRHTIVLAGDGADVDGLEARDLGAPRPAVAVLAQQLTRGKQNALQVFPIGPHSLRWLPTLPAARAPTDSTI